MENTKRTKLTKTSWILFGLAISCLVIFGLIVKSAVDLHQIIVKNTKSSFNEYEAIYHSGLNYGFFLWFKNFDVIKGIFEHDSNNVKIIYVVSLLAHIIIHITMIAILVYAIKAFVKSIASKNVISIILNILVFAAVVLTIICYVGWIIANIWSVKGPRSLDDKSYANVHVAFAFFLVVTFAVTLVSTFLHLFLKSANQPATIEHRTEE
ncbi:hypothetical protein [Mycoplasmopsis fermentans]|uniref:hypothetical protein n=1 Tax=Mycoplasmopsis fermentans TaxID=2115 RepID=UPI000F03A693|nr:hypothetical protein [Mycoplasmopsis fermentans]RMX35307.1 hypothetical protein MFI2_0481 [Mycoplasmopsis fermentans MF-I2]